MLSLIARYSINKITNSKSITSSKLSSLHAYVSEITDPVINMTLEKWLINKNIQNISKQPILYIWRNNPVVLIGRNQNPYKECNLQNILKDKIQLIRRNSGGGTVYQDLGNTNFSFIENNNTYNTDRNCQIIINALKKFNIESELTPYNNIIVNKHKISGSAYQLMRNIHIHHGTLLLNVDMRAMTKYITPNKKMESKSVDSLPVPVMNLFDLNPNVHHYNITDAIIEEFSKMYKQECQVIKLDTQIISEELLYNSEFFKMCRTYVDWDWTFGNTSQFKLDLQHQFSWGLIILNIDSDNGKIQDITIHSDIPWSDMITSLIVSLKNCRLEKSCIINACKNAENEMDRYINLEPFEISNCKKYIQEFGNWFCTQI